MKLRNPILTLILTVLVLFAHAQKRYAYVQGRILNESEDPLGHVSIVILGQQKGIIASDSGTFHIKVPANKAFALLFSFSGYKTTQQNFLLNEGEEESTTIRMEPSADTLKHVVIQDNRSRTEAGLIRLNPKAVINMPSPVMGVENLIKVFVGSNNELTSQYSVRGGSFDENLIYVNDFEIFRPYLVRNGQQEGLSFINPELVRNINFYNGGFQAKYGDKMSSVLDIQYNTPAQSGGSAYISLLEQGFHLQGTGSHNKLSYLVGARSRTNRSLLSSQETQGSYTPSSADIQTLIDYRFSDRWQAEFLGNLSRTSFTLVPEYSQLTSSVISPYYTSNIGVDTYFDGQERDRYSTAMAGFSATYQPTRRLKLKWLASRFEDNEAENIDITGAYLFGDRDFDPSSSTFGSIVNPLGSGLYQNFARNQLNITNYNISHKGSYKLKSHLFQWGLSYDKTRINDHLNEWNYQDSAGYSLPYNPSILTLSNVLYAKENLNINKYSGFIQDNMAFSKNGNEYTIQAGLRFNYNDLNHEFLLSPRISGSVKPNWKKDIVFKLAAGSYNQPPFYREMRRYDGTLNTQLKAQKSWQGTAGFDYSFHGLGRPLRLTAEAYYKYMTDVDPYDLDNVRIRYYGENSAKAYTTGVELRLFGELVKDAESWVSIGLMRSRENIENDFYQVYKVDSLNKPVDSTTVQGGWLRRPNDRLITFGMFFQDYLSTNKNFKVYLNLLYGTNLPYNIPGSVKYRNAMTIPPYIRTDIGFSALLLDGDKSHRRSHSPFRNFNSIWASLEVFNLIDRENTISYMLIRDYQNNIFTMPNRLTPRLLNFKVVARW